jgi:hypothetical protein
MKNKFYVSRREIDVPVQVLIASFIADTFTIDEVDHTVVSRIGVYDF